MGRLPTADDLGFRNPEAGLAVIRQPDSNGFAEGLQTLGRTLAAIGARDRAEKERLSDYKFKSDLETFQWDQKLAYQQTVDTAAEDGSDIWTRREADLQKARKEWDKRPMSPEQRQVVGSVFDDLAGKQRFEAYMDARDRRWKWQDNDVRAGAERTLSQGFASEQEMNAWWNAQVAKIDATDLPAEVKSKLKADVASAGGARFLQDNFRGMSAKPQQTGGAAATLIRKFEGFREKPYYDVTAYRAGYGSDTVTMADGKILRVRPGMKVSRQDAERDLARRAAAFAEGAKTAVGAKAWGALNDNQRAALTSIAYNYGDLPKTVIAAVKKGGADGIANAVEGLKSHNGGINARRRQEEADIIRGASAVVADAGPQERLPAQKPTGGLWDYMPSDVWDGLYSDTQKAYVSALKDGIDLGIEQGGVARDDILSAQIDDGDKAVLLRRWDDKHKDEKSVADFVQRLTVGAIDPSDEVDKKAADKLMDGAGGVAALMSGDDQAVSLMFQMWDKGAIIAKGAKGALEALLRSKDPAKVNTALSYLEALDSRNHRAFQQSFNDGTESLVIQYRDNVAFDTPEAAAKRVMETATPAVEAVRKDRGKEAEKAADKFTVADVMNDVLDPSYLPFDQPGAPSTDDAATEMMGDYRRLYVEAYKQTGDAAQAKKIASAQLTRVWGASVANSGRVMKYPPEALYGPAAMVDGSFDWMKEAIAKELIAEGLFTTEDRVVAGSKGGAKHVQEKVPLKTYLLADGQTVAESKSGVLPSYQVWVTKEDGSIDIAPNRIFFDVKPYRDAARATATVEQGINLETRKQEDAVDSIANRRKKILEQGTRY